MFRLISLLLRKSKNYISVILRKIGRLLSQNTLLSVFLHLYTTPVLDHKNKNTYKKCSEQTKTILDKQKWTRMGNHERLRETGKTVYNVITH